MPKMISQIHGQGKWPELVGNEPQNVAMGSDDDSGYAMDALVYAWVPPNASPELISAYFASIPAEKVPRLGSRGEQWRLRQLERQMPAQDRHFCAGNSRGEGEKGEEAGRHHREELLLKRTIARGTLGRVGGAGKVYCHQCKSPIDGLAVSAAPTQHDAMFSWHPCCFVCVECKELLVDLLFFGHNGNAFCGRHHAELLKPRCSGCDQLIFEEECTEAEGRLWHLCHFCCSRCGLQLGGCQYLMQEEGGEPLCLACVHPDWCRSCGKAIPSEWPHIAQGDFRWHADGQCFCCAGCKRPLLGKSYALRQGRLFCQSALRACAEKSSPIFNGKNVPNRLPRPSPMPTRALRFSLKQEEKLKAILPPPLPKCHPPPVPPIQQKSSSSFSCSPRTENVYETVAMPSGTFSTATTATMAKGGCSTSSSGCSANGSLISSSSTGGSSVKLLRNASYTTAAASSPVSQHPYLEDLLSSSEGEEEAIGIGAEPAGRRRCLSVGGRRRARRRKMTAGEAVPAPAIPLQLAQWPEMAGRRCAMAKISRKPFRSPFEQYSESTSTTEESTTSSSDIDEDDEDGLAPRRAFIRHYLAAVAEESAASASQNGLKKEKKPGAGGEAGQKQNGKIVREKNGIVANGNSRRRRRTQSNCRIS